MKLSHILASAGLAVAVIAAAPASAQHERVVTHRTTTVTRVHGPLNVLPHHDRKICTTQWRHHQRVRRCHYR